mmetsp:Transcript_29737/g.30237  ORF Transcript_29737/g.30237 Transcript_29737/m.30237 type:complete len:198 (-) Transcript_29737:87-680(-)
MTKVRGQLLKSMGFHWNLRTRGTAIKSEWMAMYQQLIVYKQEHRESTMVPRNEEQDPTLSQWVYQRLIAYQQQDTPTHIAARDTEDPTLGLWGTHQRRDSSTKNYHDGTLSTVDSDGISWSVRGQHGQQQTLVQQQRQQQQQLLGPIETRLLLSGEAIIGTPPPPNTVAVGVSSSSCFFSSSHCGLPIFDDKSDKQR